MTDHPSHPQDRLASADTGAPNETTPKPLQVKSPAKRWALITLSVLLALVFFATGATKLLAVQRMVDVFDLIGWGQWFRYVTGALEVMAALLLLIPQSRILGAALIVCIMIGAVITHAVIGGRAIPAVVLGLMAGFIGPLSRPIRLGR